MIFCYETENWEVYEGPPIGKVLKTFAFHKSIRKVLTESDELRRKVDDRLNSLAKKLERGEAHGLVLMKEASVECIAIVRKEDYPEEILEHMKNAKTK